MPPPDGHGYAPELADLLTTRRNTYRPTYGSVHGFALGGAGVMEGAPQGVFADIFELCCCATNAQEAMGVAVVAAPFLGCGLDLNIQCTECRFEISVNAHAHPRSTSPKLISVVVQNAQDSLSKVRGGKLCCLSHFCSVFAHASATVPALLTALCVCSL